MNLKAEQRRLYDLLQQEARCFARVCDDGGALWVSDLPRKKNDCEAMADKLCAAGFAVRLDAQAKLWYVDWTWERWQEMLADVPDACPALPEADAWHEAYALCRLWLTHPAPFMQEHLPAVRRVLKLTAEPPREMLHAIRSMHEEAAVQLRAGKSIAHAAGRILAAWLNKHVYGKENEP